VKVGDLVRHKKDKIRGGYGYILKMQYSVYPDHPPWVTCYWPSWNRTTRGLAVHIEVLSESR